MSDFQYFEFRAVDRKLDEREMRELRVLSRRARITPTSFRNSYNWGEFRGDPDELVDRYFDAYIHIASGGMHRLMFRVPKTSLDSKVAKLYSTGESAWVRTTRSHVMLGFLVEDEEGGWEEEANGCLDQVISLRAELVSGDHRVLYLGWLAGVASGEVPDEKPEPPVPPGLGELTPALESFAELFRIDRELIDAAAAPTAEMEPPDASELTDYISTLAPREKDELLVRTALGHAGRVRSEILRGYESAAALKPGSGPKPERRTAGGLRAIAERQIASGSAPARKRGERVKTAERLESREAESWRQVDALIGRGDPQTTREAIELLLQLRNLSNAMGHSSRYAEHILAIRQTEASNEPLMKLMDAADLGERPVVAKKAAARSKAKPPTKRKPITRRSPGK